MSRLSMTIRQSLSPILSDTTYKVANSSSSADTLYIISTPFLQSALCKDGVQFYYSLYYGFEDSNYIMRLRFVLVQ